MANKNMNTDGITYKQMLVFILITITLVLIDYIL